MMSFKATSSTDKMKSMVDSLLELTKKEVLVGVPSEKASRKNGGEINNAQLARIHDLGSPLASIPARPFMEPGISKAQDRISEQMLKAARAQLDGEVEKIDVALETAGVIASNSIKKVINEGEGFTPLKRATLLGRLRRRQEAKDWSKEKREEVMGSFHPLVDTGQLRNSVTYVVRNKE
jgi:hypothetical protein